MCLNVYEDVVLNFKFFFEKLYLSVFGGILVEKLKLFWILLCVIVVLVGW